jgi:hypothetical protein
MAVVSNGGSQVRRWKSVSWCGSGASSRAFAIFVRICMAVCKIELRQASLSVLGVCLEVCVVNTDQWSKLTGQGPVDVPPVKD